jgi:hypothetical protein
MPSSSHGEGGRPAWRGNCPSKDMDKRGQITTRAPEGHVKELGMLAQR